jgi:hypothetical protein
MRCIIIQLAVALCVATSQGAGADNTDVVRRRRRDLLHVDSAVATAATDSSSSSSTRHLESDAAATLAALWDMDGIEQTVHRQRALSKKGQDMPDERTEEKASMGKKGGKEMKGSGKGKGSKESKGKKEKESDMSFYYF